MTKTVKRKAITRLNMKTFYHKPGINE